MNTDTQTWTGITRSAEQTVALGRIVARHCLAGDVVALVGELGAGKTQFVRGLAEGMGVDGADITSPTFVIVQEYQPDAEDDDAHTPGSSRPVLVHIDAYRIRSLDELESIGWPVGEAEALSELRRGAVVAVEWADRIDGTLGAAVLEVRLSHLAEHEREVSITVRRDDAASSQKAGAGGGGRGGIGESWDARIAALITDLPQLPAAESSTIKSPAATTAPTTSPCPICQKSVTITSEHFPFCSARCKLLDLGKWLGGDYRISRPIDQADLDEV